ncbi:adhesion G-protein coupled receptor V1-like [Dysidea avara]|uniref:adhesion G-protein coupled receptor V1-like n=1 Tax=Dysidea avara TaxID=196820 RepID=UPI003323B6C2
MIHLVVLYFLVISTANGQTACNTARAALAANAQCEQTITMVVESVSNLILVSAESAAQACSINCKPLYEDMIAECESGNEVAMMSLNLACTFSDGEISCAALISSEYNNSFASDCSELITRQTCSAACQNLTRKTAEDIGCCINVYYKLVQAFLVNPSRVPFYRYLPICSVHGINTCEDGTTEEVACSVADDIRDNSEACLDVSNDFATATDSFDPPSQTIVETVCGPACRDILGDVASACGIVDEHQEFPSFFLACTKNNENQSCILVDADSQYDEARAALAASGGQCSSFTNNGTCDEMCAMVITELVKAAGCCYYEYYRVINVVIRELSNDITADQLLTTCGIQDPGRCGCTISAPTNGTISCTGDGFGDTCNITCDGYLVVYGNSTITCNFDGTWSDNTLCIQGVIVTVDDGSKMIQINENSGPVNISLSLDQPSVVPITIVATPQVRSPPSATVNDFDNSTVTVVVNPGETRAFVLIGIVNDDTFEGIEFFDVAFEIDGRNTAGAVIGELGVAQVSIFSDDVVLVSFIEREFSGNEGEGLTRIGLQLSEMTEQIITVQVGSVGISAEGNGRDFNSSLTNATFLPGEITSFINIPLTDDIIAEPSENFRVSLVMEQPFAALGVIHGDPSSATVFITDDDVNCGNPRQPVNGQVTFTTDYRGSIATYNCNEGYVLCGSRNRTCQPNGLWSGSPPDCIRVTVMVDDAPRLMRIHENIGPVNISLSLDQPSVVPITIVATPQVRSPPSATVNDFDNSTVTVVVNPGETRAFVLIGIVDDDKLEGLELFDVAFEIGGTNTDGVVIGEPHVAIVGIDTDDVVKVSFIEKSFSAIEGTRSMRVGLQLSRSVDQTITVDVGLVPMSAEGGVDYVSRLYRVSFPPGATRSYTAIQIIDDPFGEIDENFRLSFSVQSAFYLIGVRNGDPGQAIGIIIDDDVNCGSLSVYRGQVNYTSDYRGSVAKYSCDEGYALCGPESRTCQSNGLWSGTRPFCARVRVTLDDESRNVQINENTGLVSVSLSIQFGVCYPITIVATPQVRSPPSATVDDFDNSTVTVVVNPGETRAFVLIGIVDDDKLEGLEHFDVAFEIGGTNTAGAEIRGQRLAQIAISSDDVVSVSFTERQFSVNEKDGSLTVGFQLNKKIDHIVTIQVLSVGNTAKGNGVDFYSSLRNVTFLPGAITSFTNILIIDDIIAEPIEQFRLSIEIQPSFSDIGVIHGDPSSADVFITDDDVLVECPNLPKPDNGQVHFTTTYGGSIATYSCDERYVLYRSENRTCQSNGSWSGPAPECIMLNISLEVQVDAHITENSGPVNISLSLDQPSVVPITVVATPQVRSPPSATVDDFNKSTVTVVINPGEISAVVFIEIFDDNLLEILEFFEVHYEIKEPSNAEVIFEPFGFTLVDIVSDDVLAVSFIESVYNISEGAGSIRIGLQLSRRIQQTIPLQVTSVGNSAEGDGIDFDSSLKTVTFLPGETTTFISIPITDDTIAEYSENFTLSLSISRAYAARGLMEGDLFSATVIITDNDACSIGSLEAAVEVTGNTATITFSPDPPHPRTILMCKLDRRSFRRCTSPLTYNNLMEGSHRVIIRGRCPEETSRRRRRLDFTVTN